MTSGTFRDGHPRITLELPTQTGVLSVEFIVDTGYEGDITMPPDLARQVDAMEMGSRRQSLADGTIHRIPLYQTALEWEGEQRTVEMLVLGGQPLIGTDLLGDMLLQVEVTEGGEVTIEHL